MTFAVKKNVIHPISLGILCFQGLGLRIFEGVFNGGIVVWAIVLFLLNFKYVAKQPNSYWIKVIGIIFFYVAFCYFKGVTPAMWLCVAWVSAAICISPYCCDDSLSFVDDMRKMVKFCMYYDLMHIPVMIFAKDMLLTTSFGMHPKTFLYLFYFNYQEGFLGLNRIQGFCWEPSCWNLLLNLNLVFALYFRESKKIIALSVLSILVTMSTTGFVTMCVCFFVYYVSQIRMKNILSSIPIIVIFVALVFPIVWSDFSDKIELGSGQARFGDFAIASAVLAEHPLLGEDVDNITQNSVAMTARHKIWTSKGDYKGYMEQGMVNSFAALLVEWGICLFLVILWMTFNSPLIPEKKLRLMVVVTLFCILMGAPIARTGLFYMFPISYLLFSRKNKLLNQ